MNTSLNLILVTVLLSSCHAWDQSELEIFDLIEEINQNFYDVLGVPQVSRLPLLHSISEENNMFHTKTANLRKQKYVVSNWPLMH